MILTLIGAIVLIFVVFKVVGFLIENLIKIGLVVLLVIGCVYAYHNYVKPAHFTITGKQFTRK